MENYIENQNSVSVKVCPNCKAQLVDSQKYCAVCGSPCEEQEQNIIQKNATGKKKKTVMILFAVIIVIVVCIVVSIIAIANNSNSLWKKPFDEGSYQYGYSITPEEFIEKTNELYFNNSNNHKFEYNDKESLEDGNKTYSRYSYDVSSLETDGASLGYWSSCAIDYYEDNTIRRTSLVFPYNLWTFDFAYSDLCVSATQILYAYNAFAADSADDVLKAFRSFSDVLEEVAQEERLQNIFFRYNDFIFSLYENENSEALLLIIEKADEDYINAWEKEAGISLINFADITESNVTESAIENATQKPVSKYPTKEEFLNACKEICDDLTLEYSESFEITNINYLNETLTFDIEFSGVKWGYATALSPIDINDVNYGRIIGVQCSADAIYFAPIPIAALVNYLGTDYSVIDIIQNFGEPVNETSTAYFYEAKLNGLELRALTNKINMRAMMVCGEDAVEMFDELNITVENSEENSTSNNTVTSTESANNTSNNNTANNSSGNSNNSNTTTEAICANGHNWVAITKIVHHDEVGHYEDVEVANKVNKYRCPLCGYNKPTFDSLDEYYSHFDSGVHDDEWNAGAFRERYEIVEDWEYSYEQEWVVDSIAYDETVTTGYQCSVCGQQK